MATWCGARLATPCAACRSSLLLQLPPPQAVVRGHLVRRQDSHTLCCMQVLVAAQNRACVWMIEEEKLVRTPLTTLTLHSSPHHPGWHQQVRGDPYVLDT